MSRLLATLALALLLCPAAALARQEQRQATGARLIDVFDDRLLITDIKARLDIFAVELQQHAPPDVNGLIVFYGARHKFPGWAGRRAHAYHGYLTDVRGLGASRVSIINGGLRDETKFELWIVSARAEMLPAEPFDLSLLMSGEKGPLPFDRFDVVERGDTSIAEEGEYYPDATGLYDYLAEVLRADPGLRACVVAYTSRRGARGSDRRIAASAKAAIVKSQAVDVRRVVAFGGGRRRYKVVEIWLVPPGAPLPKPTPDVFGLPSRHRP